MLLADAVRRGEMRHDAPVSDYLPELLGTPAGAATLDQLATHHSGLPALPRTRPGRWCSPCGATRIRMR
jgi:CubicO group peptidase (beta-lactamase class C family)